MADGPEAPHDDDPPAPDAGSDASATRWARLPAGVRLAWLEEALGFANMTGGLQRDRQSRAVAAARWLQDDAGAADKPTGTAR